MLYHPENLKIHASILFECPKKWYWDSSETNIDYFDLWSVISGKGHLHTRQKDFELIPGDVFLFRPDSFYRAVHDPAHPLTIIPVHFDFIDINGNIFRPDEDALLPLHTRVADPPFYESLLRRLVDAQRGGDNDSARLLLSVALREISQETAPHPEFLGIKLDYYKTIKAFCREVMASPERQWSIKELASRLGVSKAHSGRIFKKFHHMSPREFIIQARIHKAKYLLLNSSSTVGEIADMLGYKNIYFFSRQFKEFTNLSPLAFRENNTKPD